MDQISPKCPIIINPTIKHIINMTNICLIMTSAPMNIIPDLIQ
jgi:hypothetical protein